MRIIVCENYEEVSKKAAQMILSQVTLKPNSVLGLATGSTPIGMYENLVKLNKKGDIEELWNGKKKIINKIKKKLEK